MRWGGDDGGEREWVRTLVIVHEYSSCGEDDLQVIVVSVEKAGNLESEAARQAAAASGKRGRQQEQQ
jgi:hypothetical protein